MCRLEKIAYRASERVAFVGSMDKTYERTEKLNFNCRRGNKIVDVSQTTADKGIDIILKKNGKTIVVQCKAHKKPVSPHVVRDLYGTLVDSQADEAILASISGFTSGVREFVIGKPISLISLEDIIHIQKKITLDKDNNR